MAQLRIRTSEYVRVRSSLGTLQYKQLLIPVYTMQPVVQPVVQWTTGCVVYVQLYVLCMLMPTQPPTCGRTENDTAVSYGVRV